MKLHEIQECLKAPKSQYNDFGKYKYRNCEDILEAVKPLLGDSVLTITDDIVAVGDRIYVKATARFVAGDMTTEVSAFAREPLSRKGMDESQITGAASSYARKYALGGLFLIDDSRDADSQEPPKEAPKTQVSQAPMNVDAIVKKLKNCTTLEQLKGQFAVAYELCHHDAAALAQITDAKDAVKEAIGGV